MIFRNFIAKLNWRQVVTHIVAFWFFIHAFYIFSFLHDTNLIDSVRHSQQINAEILSDRNISGSDITYFILWTGISGFIGLLTAFIISLAISIKRGWFWANTLLAFIVIYPLYRFDLLGWTYLKPFFLYPGQLFSNTTIEFLVNGIILLAAGLLVFFLKLPNRFIERRSLATS